MSRKILSLSIYNTTGTPHARATLHFMIPLFREQGRTEILSSLFSIIPSPRERPFINSHDFTEPIVRSDDGKAYVNVASDTCPTTKPSLPP